MSNRKLMLDDPAAYYMQVGAEQERERIIKLLERYQGCRDDELCAYTCSCLRSDRFIELIKGEQK
jgi:hypothetical protein